MATKEDPPALSQGSIAAFVAQGELPPAGKSVFQVIGTRPVGGEKVADNPTKFRLCISDGLSRFSHAMLVFPDVQSAKVPPNYSIIKVPSDARNVIKTVGDKNIWVICSFQLLCDSVGKTLGNPVSLQALNTCSTPSTSNTRESRTPPPVPTKRPLEKSPNNEEERVKGVKRALVFPSSTNKATHKIKDLNPYQNKYTVKARVVKKGSLKNWSNSRGEGKVFDVTLQDATGDIRVTGFNEQADKFHAVFEENKVYYLSHASIKPIHNRNYNTTCHNYELMLNTNSVVVECSSAASTADVPGIHYTLVPISDIADKADKDKIDVMGVCQQVGEAVTIQLKTGRQTKKREVQLVDSSAASIMATLWGDEAEKRTAESMLGKVVAIKAATVSDWNGKSLSCSFGSTLEIEPESLPESKALNDWWQAKNPNFATQSLSKPGRATSQGMFATLKEVKQDLKGSTASGPAKYYTLEAYLVDLKADNVVYKACSTCNRKVVELTNAGYRCEKCSQTTDNFTWRYILRGAIADATDFQWITMFDETAECVLGKSATCLAEIRTRDEIQFRKVLHGSKYQQYELNVKANLESWNDESRLKMTVAGLKKVSYASAKHVDRIKAEIAAMQQ